MTDKDEKDWCKTCNVEPPAMRFKCPECEHNPDKEQIIIDNVDVSRCGHYEDLNCFAYRDSCGYPLDCKDNPNCSYKQLKRKEQEYEELRQYHNKCCEEFEKEKQNLIDRYNQFSKDFFIGKYCKKEYCDLLKAKEQECEKLKSQVDEDYNYYTTELKTLRDIISNKEKRNAALFLTSGRYRKAFEEIEKVCIEDTRIFADGTEVRYDSLDKILDIINKAK